MARWLCSIQVAPKDFAVKVDDLLEHVVTVMHEWAKINTEF